jgi:hypothetical protein
LLPLCISRTITNTYPNTISGFNRNPTTSIRIKSGKTNALF